MVLQAGMNGMLCRISAVYARVLRAVVYTLVVISGLGVLSIMLITCADVILRLSFVKAIVKWSIVGAHDIVMIAGAVTLATSLPYTTAVKGHVAIEYFFHKFNRRGRIVIDTVTRVLGMAFFAFLGWRSALYGTAIYRSGQGSQTIQLPIFWVPYLIAFCCVVVVLVILHNLLHPGREMIKP